jgi:hypothetical protein
MGLFGPDDTSALETLGRTQREYEGIQIPNIVWKDLAPELYANETANYTLNSEDPTLKSRQMEMLSKLAGLSETGLSEADQAGYAKARTTGDQLARSGREAALQDAQARGVAGGGLEFLTKEVANQQGAQRAQEAALQQASNAAQQRAAYTTAYGDSLGKVRAQDNSANQANTDVINQFNLANTQARNQTNQANAQLKNQTQQYNNEGRTGAQQQTFNNQLARAGGMAGANAALAQGQAANAAAKQAQQNQMIQLGVGAATGGAGLAAMSAANQVQKPKKANSAGSGYGDYSAYV